MKIPPVGVELFHADGRTDMTKLIVTFRNFANAPKNCVTSRKTTIQFFICGLFSYTVGMSVA
jgi:hypothetical protein